jgi:F-type H+-transporting ATPase subunit delta
MRAIITTAVPLSESQLKKLSAALKKKDAHLEIEEVVDASVVGGLVVRIGSQEFDGSLRNKLQQLQKQVTTSW